MYVYNMDTFHLESLFNTLNIWRDKRIFFSSSQYRIRSNLAFMYWNENASREIAGIWQRSDVDGNKLGKAKKWFTVSTYLFAHELWSTVIAKVLEKVGE